MAQMILIVLQQQAQASPYSAVAALIQLDELAAMIEAAPSSWQWCIRQKLAYFYKNGRLRNTTAVLGHRAAGNQGPVTCHGRRLYSMNLPNVTWVPSDIILNDREGSLLAEIRECKVHISYSSSTAKMAVELGKPAIFLSAEGVSKFPELAGTVPHVEVKDLEATLTRLLNEKEACRA